MLLPTALAAPPVLFASGLARQPAPSMVIPALPAVAVAGAGLVAWNVRRQNKEKDAFFNMEWAEPSDTDGDGCVLIGEENAEDGKAWFVCNEPSNNNCEEIANYGEPATLGSRKESPDYLCKEPKVRPA